MSILSLHPNHLKILRALQSATRLLSMTDHLLIVGSLARFLAGQTQRVGDVDVSIDAELCKRFWDFLEVLAAHGIKPVFDVLDRPQFPWDHCSQTIAHPLALTVDCYANLRGLKHANLDIVLKSDDINSIPMSSNWAYGLNPDELAPLDASARAARIDVDHQVFLEDRKTRNQAVSPQGRHGELGLEFGW
jgi:hypothetical protein